VTRESSAAYRARILAGLGRRDPMRVLRDTPARLERIVARVPAPRMRRRPAPGAWSVLEVLVHTTDAELAFGWRLRHMLATPGARLTVWDQDLWAIRLDYHARRPDRVLAWFRAARESNLALLGAVPARRLRTCWGLHDTRGRQTVWDFVRMEAGHDLNHLRQIRETLARLE